MKNGMFRSSDTDPKQSRRHKRRESTRSQLQLEARPSHSREFDVDKFIHDNHALIQRLRKGTHWNTNMPPTSFESSKAFTTSPAKRD